MLPAAVVVRDDVVLAVGRIAAGADPGDRRHLAFPAGRRAASRRSSRTGSRRWRSAASSRNLPGSPAGVAGSGSPGAGSARRAVRARHRQQRQRGAADDAAPRRCARKPRRELRRATWRASRSNQRSMRSSRLVLRVDRRPLGSRHLPRRPRFACADTPAPSRRRVPSLRTGSPRARACSPVPCARKTPSPSMSAACGSLPTWYARPELRRQHVGALRQPVRARRRPRAPRAPRRWRAPAAARRASLRSTESRIGSSVLHTGQVGETKTSSVLPALRRRRRRSARALPTSRSARSAAPARRGAARRAPISAPAGATRSCSTPIWRTSATTTAASASDHEPEDDVGDQQRLKHAPPPSIRRAPAQRATQRRDRGALASKPSTAA